MRFKIVISFIVLFALLSKSLFGQQDTITYSDPSKNVTIGQKVTILEDKDDNIPVDEIIRSNNFVNWKQQVPNLQISASAFWVKLCVRNNTDLHALALQLEYPTIDSVTFVGVGADGTFSKIVTGEFVPYYQRSYKHQSYIFNLVIPPADTRTFFIKVVASEQMQLPLILGSSQSISDSIYNNDLVFGLYAGIIIVMLLYNLFIFFSARDKTYLYYVFYILFVGMSQACLQGYAPRFLYPGSFFLANAMMVWVPAISGIFGIYFINNFISVKTYAPVLNKLLISIQFLYLAIIILSLSGNYRLCAKMLLGTVGALVILGFITALRISLKGYRPAKFFLVAFSIFIASVIVFVMRNFNVLPYNPFTYYALQIGSACEVVLLSIALADKINIFRKEKEVSQLQTVAALQENERIVKEQNVILETKVTERTHELKIANEDLSTAMFELKEAQSQLVESEKMASLGQLTAGIAHEINNPINFVTSNIKPLNRDVHMLIDAIATMEKIVGDEVSVAERQRQFNEFMEEMDFDYLKIEIEQLLNGIGDGASRTAEIVKGLRIFSRLDEDDLKRADINEGLDSTLVITNNLMGSSIKVEKNFGGLPLIECYPGKLNQVFLNIISNAVYAIKKKFEDAAGGVLTITTHSDEDNVYVSIADNGTGMDENTKKRLFEPFFTTKEVGEGTGLGLSITYNTIAKHNGKINVNSELGVGTEFVLTLPLTKK